MPFLSLLKMLSYISRSNINAVSGHQGWVFTVFYFKMETNGLIPNRPSPSILAPLKGKWRISEGCNVASGSFMH